MGYLGSDKLLDIGNGLLGKHPIQDILSLLGFFIGKEAEGGMIFSETAVDSLFLVPSIGRFVYVEVGLWRTKMKLSRSLVQ
jgi:hypothetical protein